MSQNKTIENAPWTRFHTWTFIYLCGGMFMDGWVFGSATPVTEQAAQELRMSVSWQGALAAAPLAGIFFGSLFIGRLSDKLGRQRLLLADLLLVVVASILHIWTTDAVLLIALRLLLGIAIGAEYALGSSLMAEFAPRKHRAKSLGALIFAWTAGFSVSYLVGFALREQGVSWHWIMATSAIPAAIVLILRIGAPESPRWLVRKGKTEEAQSVLSKHYGPGYFAEDLVVEEKAADVKAGYATLFKPPYLSRTLFISIMWSSQVAVNFAVILFLPTVLGAFGVESELGANVFAISMNIVGGLLGIYLVTALRRRVFVIGTFLVMAVVLCITAAQAQLPTGVILTSFFVFILTSSAASLIQFVYPPELFPTEIRATGIGIGAAASRIGATVSTFAMPIVMASVGASWTFIMLAAICMIGAIASLLWAPETKNFTLTESSVIRLPKGQAEADQMPITSDRQS